ncbi:class I SAM-dependent methyltransferase [Aquipuribacter hungaricus]|uniref:Class I SAM-dependent methyltransferase n=1 Tax=Aquipuribacter hungaricus TaxID=545624 RepID=A0ABV7WLX6_9MICO
MTGVQSHYFDSQPGPGGGPEKVRRVELQGRVLEVRTAAGVFSGDRLDPGTAVLLRHAAELPEGGRLLDVGCGWGPLALAMAAASPAAEVWAVDVNPRARELTAANASDNGLTGVRVAAPEDVDPDLRFDAVWSNPPIRVGKEALHALLLLWLPRLAPGGRAELVVQKHLGADSLQRWLEETLDDDMHVSRAATSKGYRVLAVDRD